jgi:hypothetical protein
VTDEDRAHRGRRYGDAKALQFADDSPVTPARVLACEPNNERLYPTIERRPPWASVRIRSNAGSPGGDASAAASTDSPTSPTRRSAAAPGRAPRELPDLQVEPMRAAAAGAGSPAHGGAGGSQVPSNAPICTTARPTKAAGTVPDRRATSPRTTSEVGEARSYRPTRDATLRPRTEFLNPTGSDRIAGSRPPQFVRSYLQPRPDERNQTGSSDSVASAGRLVSAMIGRLLKPRMCTLWLNA